MERQRENAEDYFIEEELGLSGFEPEFLRPPPPFYTPVGAAEEDVFWIHPDVSHELMWDDLMYLDGGAEVEIKRVMAKAFKSSLTPAQEELVHNCLTRNAKAVNLCGITPKKLPDLVEHNPHIAIDALLLLVCSTHGPQYLQALIVMDMSLHSMEVVNKLTSLVELPTEFVHLYITNCMSACQHIKDKFLQARLVRIACVFLHSLIRNNVINIDDLFVEIQSFCIEFSKVKEANVLFRLLKSKSRVLAGSPVGSGAASPLSPSSPLGSPSASSMASQFPFGAAVPPAASSGRVSPSFLGSAAGSQTSRFGASGGATPE